MNLQHFNNVLAWLSKAMACSGFAALYERLINFHFLFDFKACFTAGMFALGAKGSRNEKHFISLGEGIANTCHESYRKTGNQETLKNI